MAIEHNLWGSVDRPWGWEIRCDLDVEDGRRFHETFTWMGVHTQPPNPQIAAKVAAAKDRLRELLLDERPRRLRELRAFRDEARARWQQMRQELIAEGEDPDGD